MIVVRRNKTQVILNVDTGLPVADSVYEFDFRYLDGDEGEAVLMERHLRKLFGDTVEQIRHEAYERGYCDGREHRKKQKHFCRFLG